MLAVSLPSAPAAEEGVEVAGRGFGAGACAVDAGGGAGSARRGNDQRAVAVVRDRSAPTASDAASDSEYSRPACAGALAVPPGTAMWSFRFPSRVRTSHGGWPWPLWRRSSSAAAKQFDGHARVPVVWRSDHDGRGLEGVSGTAEVAVRGENLDYHQAPKWSASCGPHWRAARPATPQGRRRRIPRCQFPRP